MMRSAWRRRASRSGQSGHWAARAARVSSSRIVGAGSGFAHHHSDEALRQWRDVPAERKLTWLHEALEMTRAMLPRSRRRTWLMMRREEPGASISVEALRNDWPAFAAAVAGGSETMDALMREFIARGDSVSHARELVLALREWLPFKSGASVTDAAVVEKALHDLR